MLKATQHALRVAPDDNAIARKAAERALDIDPHFARAQAILSFTYLNEGNNFWTADPKASVARAYEAALQSVAEDDRDPWAFAMLGMAELRQNRSHERATAAMRRSVELNPSNAHFRSLHSYVLAFCGEAEQSLAEIDYVMRMNPHPLPVYQGFRGRALLMLRRFDEATPCLDHMVMLMPGHSNALGYAAVAHAAGGHAQKARALVSTLVATNAYYRLGALRSLLPFKAPEDLALIIDNLAAAGLPD